MQQPKPFFRERKEDVVLAREITIDCGRAVFDALGDLANRNVLKAFGDEQIARGVQDGPPH